MCDTLAHASTGTGGCPDGQEPVQIADSGGAGNECAGGQLRFECRAVTNGQHDPHSASALQSQSNGLNGGSGGSTTAAGDAGETGGASVLRARNQVTASQANKALAAGGGVDASLSEHEEVANKNYSLAQRGGNDFSGKLGLRTKADTEDAAKGWDVAGQMGQMAGSTTVQIYGQTQQLSAQGSTSMNASYEAAANTARAAAIAQTGQLLIHAGAMAHMGAIKSDHNDAIKNVNDASAYAAGKISAQQDNAEQNAGLKGSGTRVGSAGYIRVSNQGDATDKAKMANKMEDTFELNKSAYRFKVGVDKCTGQTLEHHTSVIRTAIDTNPEDYGQTAQQWAQMAPAQKNPIIQKFATYRCQEEERQKRVTSYNDKADGMKDDMSRIASHVSDEQNAGKRVADASMLQNGIKAAVAAAQAVGSAIMAAQYDSLANKAPDAAKPPEIDTSFDPLATSNGDAPRSGGAVSGLGQGQNFAAGGEEDKQEEDKVPDLGQGFSNKDPNTPPGAGPTAPGLTAEKAPAGGAGGGGLGGGSTSPATAENGQDDEAAKLGASDSGHFGGSGSGFGAGGGGGGKKGGGNGGIDLNSLLGQLLPGKGEDKNDNGILDFGGRAPAGQGESLLDRNVDIFERIHSAYQERGRKGIVGN